MFEAKVYRIVVSTLGAILEEEHIAKETIQKWNIEHAEEAGKLFLSVPENAPVVPDLYLVVIDSYVDSTKVNEIMSKGKPIAFFFNKYHDPKNSMQAEIDNVEVFKEAMKDKYCCVDYSAARGFMSAIDSILIDFEKR